MPAPRPEIADLLEVAIPPGGKVIVVSDLHLPPVRTDVSGRSCETLARHLAEEPGPLTVVLAGDVVELLGFPEATATDILRAHEDLCAALLAVTARGGQVIYAIGNHDGDLAWDVKTADAVREMTGARCAWPRTCSWTTAGRSGWSTVTSLTPTTASTTRATRWTPRSATTSSGRSSPAIEFLGRGWVDGAHEMADPTDFPSFVGSRLVYRKLGRRLWWLIAIPLAILVLVRIPEFTSFRSRYPDTDVWVHRGEILGYGAMADLIVLAAVVAILARRAWLSISALALDERGYGQNHAARQRAADLVADGYHGFISGPHAPSGAGRHRGRLLRQLRIVHLGRGGDRRTVRPAPGVRAEPADLLGGDRRRDGRAGLGPGRAARRDQDGAVRRPRPQSALRHPGAGRLLARRPRLAARRTRKPTARSPFSVIPRSNLILGALRSAGPGDLYGLRDPQGPAAG